MPKFIQFTCEELISTGLKEDGTHGKKKTVGMPSWKKGDKNTPLEDYHYDNDYYEIMCNPPNAKKEHKVKCILTGKINNITVIIILTSQPS